MLVAIAQIPPEGLKLHLQDQEVLLRLPEGGTSCLVRAEAFLTLTRTNRGVLAEGEVTSTLLLVCSRCSEPFTQPVQEAFSVYYQQSEAETLKDEEVELGHDDLDTEFLEGETLDLTALLQQNLLLALPVQPLCREDCQGLCPRCGVNRNTGSCACPGTSPDPRFKILEQFRGET